MVGQGAHEYGVTNNIVAVDPFNLVSGNELFFIFNYMSLLFINTYYFRKSKKRLCP